MSEAQFFFMLSAVFLAGMMNMKPRFLLGLVWFCLACVAYVIA